MPNSIGYVWCCAGREAAAGPAPGQAKVAQLEVAGVCVEQVGQLDVPVHHPAVVQEGYRLQQLGADSKRKGWERNGDRSGTGFGCCQEQKR